MPTDIQSTNGVAWYIAWGIYVAMIIIGAVDLYLLYSKGETGTVTVAIRGISQKYPIITLAVGIILGHLFWAK